MEARVARLETGVPDIKATPARLEPVLGRVARDLAEVRSGLTGAKADVKGLRSEVADLKTNDLVELKVGLARLEGRMSQLPTTIQMIGSIFAVLALAGFTRYLGI